MLRKFEYVNRVKSTGYETKDPGFELPKRSTKCSAGYDFVVPEDTVCKSHQITMVKSGVKAYYITIKVKHDENSNFEEIKDILNGVQTNIIN